MHHTLIEAALFGGVGEKYLFSRQGAVDEDRFSVDVGDTPTVVAEGFDGCRYRLGWQFFSSS
jgi:hypothetical protein